MRKVFFFMLMFLCIAGSMDAAGYRGHNRGRSYGRSHRGGGGSYTHSIGGVAGNMFGASYKGFIFGVDGLALQADLAFKLQISPTKSDIKLPTGKELHSNYDWTNYTIELNPNLVYQKELCSAGSSTLALYGGGGVSLGMMKSLNKSSSGAGSNDQLFGKFGVNGIIGLEFIWSRFALSLDARPGYGLAFNPEYEYGIVKVKVDRNLRHFFDFGASIGFRYCF